MGGCKSKPKKKEAEPEEVPDRQPKLSSVKYVGAYAEWLKGVRNWSDS